MQLVASIPESTVALGSSQAGEVRAKAGHKSSVKGCGDHMKGCGLEPVGNRKSLEACNWKATWAMALALGTGVEPRKPGVRCCSLREKL